MKTMLMSLAASAVLAAPVHARGVPQDELHARFTLQHEAPAARWTGEARPSPLQPATGERAADPAAEIVFAIPVGFTGFHGVDLAAASLAGGHLRSPVLAVAEYSAPPALPYPARESGRRHRRPSASAQPADTEAGVPEAGTLAILSFGLAGLIVSSRKKA